LLPSDAPSPRQSAGEFAEIYRKNNLTGAHVIKLGPGNDAAAKEALAAWPGVYLHFPYTAQNRTGFPGGLQIGGGINEDNAKVWLEAGASKVRQAAIQL
jgi:phosphoribosylformimino-5-aminoimidazole carboxamide ribotide isomerase